MINKFWLLIEALKWILHPFGLRRHLEDHTNRLAELCESVEFLKRCRRSHAWVYGHRMTLDPDDSVVSLRLCQDGSFEHFETELALRDLAEGNVVVDVGANIGYYTLLFARRVGPGGHVYAFEPDPHNFDLLRRNVLQNGYTNVTCVPCAVSERAGFVRLYRNAGNRGDHRIYDSHDGREAIDTQCISLDDFFVDVDRAVNFIKMDIQGAEAQALRGMRHLLARSPGLRIVTEFWPRGMTLCGDNPRQFLDDLQALGFDVGVIDEQGHRILTAEPQQLLDRLPVEPDHDLAFTNLYCRRLPPAKAA
jgi:FkbM family methyltransferase